CAVPTIAILAGDGIGPEVTGAAREVLQTLRGDLEIAEAAVGAAAMRSGRPALPLESLELCRRSDAVLFGAVGSPEYDGKPLEERPEGALLALRSQLQLY